MLPSLMCLSLLAASASGVLAQTWKTHRYVADGFEAEFSGDVFVKPLDLSAENKKTIVRATSYVQGDASTAYLLNATLFKDTPNLDVLAERGFGVLKCKATIGDRPLTIAGGRARELRGSDCDKGVNAEARYFSQGKWLYQALALYKKDGGDEQAARYFVRSFKLIASEASRSDAPIIRTLHGLRYEVPVGWEWTEFTGDSATIQHIATKSGEKGKEESPNRFSVVSGATPGDAFDHGWDRLDRNQQRRFPGGAVARWKAGARWNATHYAFAGEARIGSKALSVSFLDRPTPRMDVKVVEAAFLRIAETLRDVPESTAIYHPSLRIAVEELTSESWYTRFDGRHIAFACWPSPKGCGKGSNTWAFAYPSSIAFPDGSTALADITGHFARNAGLKIGPARRAEFPGGEVHWTEQPGTSHPFLAAVRRDGRYFFVTIHAGTAVSRTNDALRPDFLAIAKHVRAWDGQ